MTIATRARSTWSRGGTSSTGTSRTRTWASCYGLILSLGCSLRASQEPSCQTGEASIAAGIATAYLPDGTCYQPGAAARELLARVWGTRPSDDVAGIVRPHPPKPGTDPPWAIAVTYLRAGHVVDRHATDVDVDALLEHIRRRTDTESAKRRDQGLAEVRLVGWADPPEYDATHRRLRFATRYRIEGRDRPLIGSVTQLFGRRGLLTYTTSTDDVAYPTVAKLCRELAARTRFTNGNRYEDYEPGIDELSELNIADLILGEKQPYWSTHIRQRPQTPAPDGPSVVMMIGVPVSIGIAGAILVWIAQRRQHAQEVDRLRRLWKK